MDDTPAVLILQKPFIKNMSEKFDSTGLHFLKPWESDLLLKDFINAHADEIVAVVVPALMPLPGDLIRLIPRLGCVIATSVGVNHIDIAACRERGIVVGNVGGVFSDDTADYAVGMLVDVFRRISASDRYLRGGFWKSGEFRLTSKVSGKRVGIVGLGNIGSAVAKRLLAFGCTVSYTSRSKKHEVSFPFYSNTMELAAANDVLILTCALTNETKHIVNKHVLSALGKNGIIINVGRGALIDEKELVRSLVEGEIGGAGLDVFEDEPNVPKELFDMDNVVLSPHSAVLTHESLQDVCDITVGNLQAFFANKPLLSEVK